MKCIYNIIYMKAKKSVSSRGEIRQVLGGEWRHKMTMLPIHHWWTPCYRSMALRRNNHLLGLEALKTGDASWSQSTTISVAKHRHNRICYNVSVKWRRNNDHFSSGALLWREIMLHGVITPYAGMRDILSSVCHDGIYHSTYARAIDIKARAASMGEVNRICLPCGWEIMRRSQGACSCLMPASVNNNIDMFTAQYQLLRSKLIKQRIRMMIAAGIVIAISLYHAVPWE